MRKELLVYNGPGVSKHSFHYIEKELKAHYKIHFISLKDLLNGSLLKSATTFLMPGGRDIFYHQELQGLGNNLIKEFVLEGGNYLGICAGAYYATSYIEFAKNSALEVKGKRDLEFVDAIATGPLLGIEFSYDAKTAKNIEIYYQSQTLQMILNVYYHGGCAFKNLKNCEILAYYDLRKTLPAIVYKKFGKGKVLLSGVHFEYPIIQEQKTQKEKRAKLIEDILKKLNHTPKSLSSD